MRQRVMAIGAGVALAAAAAGQTTRIDVDTNDGRLGTIAAFDRASSTIAEVYAHDGGRFTGDLATILLDDAINVFYVDTADGLGFFAVAGDGRGGDYGTAWWAGELGFSHDSLLHVEDDGHEGVRNGNAGSTFIGGQAVELGFAYDTPFTDGVAFGVTDRPGSWADLIGFSTWGNAAGRVVFHSASGPAIDLPMADAGGGVRLTIVPAAGAGAAVGAGLVLAGVRRRR